MGVQTGFGQIFLCVGQILSVVDEHLWFLTLWVKVHDFLEECVADGGGIFLDCAGDGGDGFDRLLLKGVGSGAEVTI